MKFLYFEEKAEQIPLEKHFTSKIAIKILQYLYINGQSTPFALARPNVLSRLKDEINFISARISRVRSGRFFGS